MVVLTIREALVNASDYLKKKGADTFRLDAEVLLAYSLGRDRTYLYREALRTLTCTELCSYRSLIKRRGAGEPVAYIVGNKEFMGLDFMVSPFCLIPRPETELLVQTALALLVDWPVQPIAVDVGTGSGAIAVSLAYYGPPDLTVHATDLSLTALACAIANGERCGVKVHWHHGDLLTPLKGVLNDGEKAAVITANLPYIASRQMPELPKSVRLYEPALALDGGIDGLELYRRVIPHAYDLLAPQGALLMEISPEQNDLTVALLNPLHWQVDVVHDLSGAVRMVRGVKR